MGSGTGICGNPQSDLERACACCNGEPIGDSAAPADPVEPAGTVRADWVKVLREEYEYLKGRDDTLMMLENAGVDNWEWYGEALRGGER